jgi:multidrug transporter EmrE-like cation transporter
MIKAYLVLMGTIPVIGLVVLASASVIIGDFAAKAWSVSQKPYSLVLAFLGYFLSGFFYIPTLLREGLIVTSVMWAIISTVGFLVIGFVIFKEQLSLMQIIAVTIGIMSILMLSVFE